MMAMVNKMMRDMDIDDLLAAASAAPRDAPAALLARVLEDAYDAQPQPAAPARMPRRRAGPWARLISGLGGGPALTGLGAAALGGLWIGFAAPASVTSVTDRLGFGVTVESVDLIPDITGFLAEG
jgi:predicted lipid-binding transport protein (Tim44 family)